MIFVVGKYIGVCVNVHLEISDLKRVIKVRILKLNKIVIQISYTDKYQNFTSRGIIFLKIFYPLGIL